MRVLQLIDSLETGGAEKMAVNLANGFLEATGFGALAATRKEGPLKGAWSKDIHFFYARKKSIFDFRSLLRLRRFVTAHRIGIVQAHGTSFLTAVLLKWTKPGLRIVWHEHYGGRAAQSKLQNLPLVFSSFFFSAAFAVNQELVVWMRRNLGCRKVFFVPNFLADATCENPITTLKGTSGRRISLIANLKTPKNHHRAVRAFSLSGLAGEGWSLHLVGKDFSDEYARTLRELVKKEQLQEAVFFYGSRADVPHILSQTDIGLLASTAEGFPVTLLEYGRSALVVVASGVGECTEILGYGAYGWLFDPTNLEDMSSKIRLAALSLPEGKMKGVALAQNLQRTYDAKAIINKIMKIYAELAR